MQPEWRIVGMLLTLENANLQKRDLGLGVATWLFYNALALFLERIRFNLRSVSMFWGFFEHVINVYKCHIVVVLSILIVS